VQKIDVIAMLDSSVAAACAVLMGMVRARHDQPPSSSMDTGAATNSAACSSAVLTKSATCRSAIAATDHQSFGSQQPEALRNGGKFFA
jgi:hypothetical protein